MKRLRLKWLVQHHMDTMVVKFYGCDVAKQGDSQTKRASQHHTIKVECVSSGCKEVKKLRSNRS